jgi:hypothetical protein
VIRTWQSDTVISDVRITIFAFPVRGKKWQSDTVMGNVIITIFAFPFREKKNLTVWYSNGQCDQNNIRFTISCKASLTVWHSNEQCDHKHNRFLLGNFWRHIKFKRCKHNSLECIRFQNKIRKCLNRSCLLSLSIFLNNSRVLRLSIFAWPVKANSSTLIYPSLSRSQASNLHGSNKVTAFAGKLRLYKYIQNRYKLKIVCYGSDI